MPMRDDSRVRHDGPPRPAAPWSPGIPQVGLGFSEVRSDRSGPEPAAGLRPGRIGGKKATPIRPPHTNSSPDIRPGGSVMSRGGGAGRTDRPALSPDARHVWLVVVAASRRRTCELNPLPMPKTVRPRTNAHTLWLGVSNWVSTSAGPSIRPIPMPTITPGQYCPVSRMIPSTTIPRERPIQHPHRAGTDGPSASGPPSPPHASQTYSRRRSGSGMSRAVWKIA
jgi:hypothetical protein